jgi:hypothetical protein
MRFARRPDPADQIGDATQLYPYERPLTLGEFAAQGMPTLAAIKRRCMDCAGGAVIGAKSCTSYDCDLWPFRVGKNPNRAGIGNAGHFAGQTPTHGPAGRDGAEIGATVPGTVGRASAAA